MFNLIISAIVSIGSNKLRSALTLLGVTAGVSAVVALIGMGNSMSGSVNQDLNNLGITNITVEPKFPDEDQVFSQDTGTTRMVDKITFEDRTSAQQWENKDAYSDVITSLNRRSVVWAVGKQPIADASSSETAVRGFAGARQSNFEADNVNSFSTSVIGVVAQHADVNNYKFKSGSFINNSHLAAGQSKVAVLGETISADLFGSSINPIGATISIENIQFVVIGVIDGKSPFTRYEENVFIPINTFVDEFGASYTSDGEIQISNITVVSRDVSLVRKAADEILTLLTIIFGDSAITDFIISAQEDSINSALQSTRALVFFFNAVSVVTLSVSGIGVMNTMLVTVTERKEEIGLRRALGATKANIISQFLIEAIVITSIGGAIGIIGGIYLGQSFIDLFNFNTGGNETPLPSFQLTAGIVLYALSTSVGVGLIFGIYPAFRAATLQPAVALRKE